MTDDVVYNSTTNLWACCGNDSDGTPRCSDPTNYTFEAPSPQSLLAQTVAFVTLSSASASSSSTSISSDLASADTSITPSSLSATVSALSASYATPTSQLQSSTSTNNKPLPNDSEGLSPGAKAGIGIGAAAGALILLAALYLAFRWIIKKRAAAPANSDGKEETGFDEVGYNNAQKNYVHIAAKVQGTSPAELPVYSATGELDAEREYWEMQ